MELDFKTYTGEERPTTIKVFLKDKLPSQKQDTIKLQ